VASYAQRKGWSLHEAERWLAPNLGYDPAVEAAGATAGTTPAATPTVTVTADAA
jgi:hypothetical protein